MVTSKKLCFSLLLIFSLGNAYSQGCNCPTVATCNACGGEFVSLTFRYNGPGNSIISAFDGDGMIFLDFFVAPGNVFTVRGNQGNGRFREDELTIWVNGFRNFTTDTDCGSALAINVTLGRFTLIAAESKDGGPLCCVPGSEDSIPPVITNCPADIQVSLTGSTCTISVPWSPPIANDACGVQSFTSSRNSGDLFNKGSNPVVYTATDHAGNISTCTFNVIVSDNSNPRITGCPANITLSATVDCKAMATWNPPTATDNCGNVTLTTTHAPNTLFSLGTTRVTYTATDAAGRISTCSFNIIVNDDSPPVITGCPSNITVFADATCKAMASWNAPTATDNCGDVTLTSTYASGTLFSLGTTTVTYTAKDARGRTASCAFNVIVIDKASPVISGCPSDITVFADPSCKAVATWTAPVATDNCGSASLQNSHNPGDTFLFGKTEVKYTAVDNGGNSSVCSFYVNVINEQGPVISNCPTDIKIEANSAGQASVSWIEPTARVQCGNFTTTASQQPGDTFGVGTHNVEYTFTDDLGKHASCNFHIVITPQEIKVDIGKAVTPDGNGINDEWIITNIEKYKNNKVVIFDRWGSVIYSALGYNNETIAWKGTNQNGALVPTGTYFYTVHITYGAVTSEQNGFIELVR